MHRLRFAALILTVAWSVPALARPDTRAMTCEQVLSLIEQSGAVSMTTGDTTYNRLVADRRFCTSSEIAEPTRVPTADTDRCRVKVCVDDEPPEG
jgi:hypothetical protein